MPATFYLLRWICTQTGYSGSQCKAGYIRTCYHWHYSPCRFYAPAGYIGIKYGCPYWNFVSVLCTSGLHWNKFCTPAGYIGIRHGCPNSVTVLYTSGLHRDKARLSYLETCVGSVHQRATSR
ncbi:hypothetical protein RRG08_010428 [Elysia crispata]|uniref:Uncharacterized protein n=1 Tax=Elysia crispata TaxID=231223 RepID=A0AAE1AC85_9GAST|nr:hypothetical protein RRG08_010428 [Elysia crispata]